MIKLMPPQPEPGRETPAPTCRPSRRWAPYLPSICALRGWRWLDEDELSLDRYGRDIFIDLDDLVKPQSSEEDILLRQAHRRLRNSPRVFLPACPSGCCESPRPWSDCRPSFTSCRLCHLAWTGSTGLGMGRLRVSDQWEVFGEGDDEYTLYTPVTDPPRSLDAE